MIDPENGGGFKSKVDYLELGDEVVFRIHSPGTDLDDTEAIAIYQGVDEKDKDLGGDKVHVIHCHHFVARPGHESDDVEQAEEE